MDIRDSIRLYLRDRGFTQTAIAKRADIPEKKLSEVLNKKRKLEVGEFFRLCDAIPEAPETLRAYGGERAAR
jgi:plasmid maintenance system antidote protein VapI